MTDTIRVTYRLETPGSVEAMAAKIAADQSTGTFTDLPGETEALKARYAARVDPRVIRRPNNRVDLVFEVREGDLTEIERIGFTGNRAFTDRRLRNVLSTKQAGILRTFIRRDVFAPDRMQLDERLLTDFYRSRGYADFRVQGVAPEVTRERDAFYVTYNISEGPRYSFGRVDVVVNNAGILRDGVLALREEDGFVRKMPSVQWKSVIETNLTGCYVMAREVVSQMLENGVSPGLVVNISSITGAGNPGQGNYAAAKAGLDAATRTWALELAQYGIRVGAIAPGLIDTPMAQALDPDERAGMVADVPLGRMGRPEEIWAALRFIVECDFFTGRVIQVDGGASYS